MAQQVGRARLYIPTNCHIPWVAPPFPAAAGCPQQPHVQLRWQAGDLLSETSVPKARWDVPLSLAFILPAAPRDISLASPPQLGVQSLILPKTWIWCFCCSWISSTALHCLQVTPWLNPPQWYAFYPSIFISPQIIQLSRYWVLAWLASPS